MVVAAHPEEYGGSSGNSSRLFERGGDCTATAGRVGASLAGKTGQRGDHRPGAIRTGPCGQRRASLRKTGQRGDQRYEGLFLAYRPLRGKITEWYCHLNQSLNNLKFKFEGQSERSRHQPSSSSAKTSLGKEVAADLRHLAQSGLSALSMTITWIGALEASSRSPNCSRIAAKRSGAVDSLAVAWIDANSKTKS